MKLHNKLKERVKMFKQKQNKNVNVIYRTDEKTRRAIDDLYVQKSERNKMVVALVLISMFIGIGVGMWFQSSNSFSSSADNIVQVSDDLKAEPQSETK